MNGHVGRYEYEANPGFVWIFICVPPHSHVMNPICHALNILGINAHVL
jgi:transposase